ncbi:hypothetical protein ALC62_11995 [Cyphomyrmex costatus]|uniref:Chitin-binding type-2 domain-containing protein n=1 Tax=Cyphomyrmex costatus TaxID=456900 RepID=A0A195C8V8_9HYME|nr:hypothetical protein ALC62_11995 [Cyphomyrmex costatus]
MLSEWSNNDGIPGVTGKGDSIFYRVPWTRFMCEWKQLGYYADPEADCQVYHICQRGGHKDSFLCPNGTLFNQERDWSARGGTPWIAPARKVSTPLTRRLQKQ